MPYTKTDWKDRVVEKPLTFTMQDNGDGTVTLIPAEGTIVDPGTPITATALNKIETQYDEVANDFLPYSGGTKDVDLNRRSLRNAIALGWSDGNNDGYYFQFNEDDPSGDLALKARRTSDNTVYKNAMYMSKEGIFTVPYQSFLRVTNNVNQTINGNSGTHSKMSLDNVILDRQSEFGTASDRFTAKEPGVYNVRIWIQTGTAPTGYLFSRIYHNGINYGVVGASQNSNYSQGNIQLSMAKGDYLEFYGEASGGTSLSVGVGGYIVWVYKIG